MVKITITIRHSCPDKKAFLEQNKREIAESLLKELEQTKDYQKFGVPTAFLRLTSLILKKNSTAEFLFELK